MRQSTLHLALVLLGACIAAVIPLGGSEEPASTPASARAPHAQDFIQELPSPKRPSSAPPPCTPEEVLREELEVMRQQLALERQVFEARWGAPTPQPSITATEDETRYRTLIEDAPGRVWSTVDCSFHPCVGLFVTEEAIYPDDVREMLGLPYAEVGVGTRWSDERYVYVAAIALTETPITDPLEEKWAHALSRRLYDQHLFDLLSIANGEELAE